MRHLPVNRLRNRVRLGANPDRSRARPFVPLPALWTGSSSSPMERAYKWWASWKRSRATGRIRSTARELDASLPLYMGPWSKERETVLFASRMAAMALGVMGAMGPTLSITSIFGMAAYSVSKRLKELGIRMSYRQRWYVHFKLLAFGSAAGLLLGILASRVLAFIVYQATPSDPIVIAGIVLAMALLGLLATWIPSQRSLSIDPLILLREE
jgi:hypothetical protein